MFRSMRQGKSFGKWSQQPRSIGWRIPPRLECLESRTVFAVGSLDPAFSGGTVITGFDLGGALNDVARAVVTQPDGKIVAAGNVQRAGAATFDFAVVRYNRDGSLDTTFDGDGKVVIPFNLGGINNDQVNCMALRSDGKILVAGFAATTGNGVDMAICRLNSDGSLDTTFSGDGKATVDFSENGIQDDRANDIELQSDGKILLAGSTSTGVDTDFAVCRLNANGSLDTTFNGDGKAPISFNLGGTNSDVAEGIGIQGDGKIVIGGTASTSTTNSQAALCRLTDTGNIDSGFATNGRITFLYNATAGIHAITDLAIQTDGNIVVVGEADNGSNTDLGIARLTSLGTFDPTFDTDGKRVLQISLTGTRIDNPEAVLIQPDGKIVVVGTTAIQEPAPDNTAHTDLFVIRFTTTGEPDPSYNFSGLRLFDLTNGGTSNDTAQAVALSNDGIIVAGSKNTGANGNDFAAIRIVRDSWVIIAPDQGGPPTVKIFTQTGTLLFEFNAYGASFTGGVRVASADVNGDSIPDILSAPGPTGAPFVNIFDGFTFQFIRQIQVYGLAFTKGINLTTGDVLGDTGVELLVAPETGGSPIVNVFNPVTGVLLKQVQVFGLAFTKGVRLATGNVDGTGKQELIVGPGAGGAPFINTFNVETATRTQSVQVFGSTFTAGLFVAGGDVNNDGNADVIVGPGFGGVPVVNIFNMSAGGIRIEQHEVFPNDFRGGVRVTAGQLILGGRVEIVAVSGPGHAGFVKVINSDTAAVEGDFLAFDGSLLSGFFVSGAVR